MKHIITLVICLVMVSLANSQTTFKPEPKVKAIVASNGDTLIEMKLSDAKIVLDELLDKPIVDSLLEIYTAKDSINANIISLQVKEIEKLQTKCKNQTLGLTNLGEIIANNSVEVNDLNDVIKQQKKEILKQKIMKVMGFTAAVVLPITIILLTHH